MIDVVEFISNNSEVDDKEELKLFLEKYKDNLIVLRNEEIVGVAFYLRLEDETLKNISNDRTILQNVENAERLIAEKGRNIHFIKVIAKDYKIVLRGLKEVIEKENPKTASWYKEDMDKINFIKLRS